MSSEPKEISVESKQIVLELLESVDRDSEQSHRRLAGELGIALGLINAYVRRCVNMGLLKVHKTPAHRYAYFLTPKGFAEKSRLTANYLSSSFTLFRQARTQCSAIFSHARDSGAMRFVLAGASEVAEIAMLCAAEYDISVVAIVDRVAARKKNIGGLPVYVSIENVSEKFDAVMVTAFDRPQKAYDDLVARLGAGYVFAPQLLGVKRSKNGAGGNGGH